MLRENDRFRSMKENIILVVQDEKEYDGLLKCQWKKERGKKKEMQLTP